MKMLLRLVLLVEPILLAVIVWWLWFPTDPTRVQILALLIPVALARLLLYHYTYVKTPLNGLMVLLLLLGVINLYVAPYTWGWYMLGRMVMGAALVMSLASLVAEHGSLDGLILVAILVCILVGVLGLGGAQYIVKSDSLQFIIQHLPQITNFPGAEGGFNVNEIGGAMAYFAPFAAAIMIYDWRTKGHRLRRWLATLAFGLLALALFLGQSQLAIVGVLLALAGLIFLLIPNGRARYLALAALLIFSAVQVGLITKVVGSDAQVLAARDENGTNVRFEIWGAGLAIVRDYPLTGVGLNQFRSRAVRAHYPVTGFYMSVVPHAHDELLQIATDMGIPGLILFVTLNGVLAWMLYKSWRWGDLWLKAVSAAAAAALGAHFFFGLADAITLFDRFAFAYWLFVGIGCAAYVLARRQADFRIPAAGAITQVESSTVG